MRDWGQYGVEDPPLTSEEQFLAVDLSTKERGLARLHDRLVDLLTDWDRVGLAVNASIAEHRNLTLMDSFIADVCDTYAGALADGLGPNGLFQEVGRAMIPELMRAQAAESCDDDEARLQPPVLFATPMLVDGIVSFDLVHAAGAYAYAHALEYPADSRAAAVTSVFSLTFLAEWPLPDGGQLMEAPIHGAAWQSLLHDLAGKRPPVDEDSETASFSRFWAVAMRVCDPYLNKWMFVQCAHGVAHAALKYVLWDADLAGEPASAVGSGPRCRAIRHSSNLTHALMQKVLRLCDATPFKGWQGFCSLGAWMDYFDHYATASNTYDGLPTAPWIEYDDTTTRRTMRLRAPCDFARPAHSGGCFARFFGTPSADCHEGASPQRVADYLAGLAPSASVLASRLNAGHLHAAMSCLSQPMAEERSRRGCIFGLALNTYQRYTDAAEEAWATTEGRRQDATLHATSGGAEGRQDDVEDGGHARDGRPAHSMTAFCGIFVDPRAAAAPETYQRELLRLLACIGGGIFGFGYGGFLKSRAPGWLMDMHCAELRDETDSELWWLDEEGRARAERVCHDAGTLCGVEGACSSGTKLLQSVGEVMTEP